MNNAEFAVGPQVAGEAAKRPERVTMPGKYVTAEPLDPFKHGDALWEGAGGTANQDLWKYLRSGPFVERFEFDAYLEGKAASEDPLYFALIDHATSRVGGHAAYMRMDTCQRVIEMRRYRIHTRISENARGHGGHVPDGASCFRGSGVPPL